MAVDVLMNRIASYTVLRSNLHEKELAYRPKRLQLQRQFEAGNGPR